MPHHLSLSENYISLKNSIDSICKRIGRDSNSIQILPTTKYVSPEIMLKAYSLGFNVFGENKVQELVTKANSLNALPIKFRFIGHLQSNKVRDCVKYASAIDTVDRLSLVEELDKQLLAIGKSIEVLVQVNTSAESNKHGIAPTDLLTFLKIISKYDTIKLKGLMMLALNSDHQEKVRACFRLLKKLQLEAQNEAISGIEMHELSMGMSSDYQLAIEEGSTMLRIGTRLFGERLNF